MTRTPWSDESEEALDQPVTLTERQLRSLKRRGMLGVLAAALAAVALALLAVGIFRTEGTLKRYTAQVASLGATLPDSVRAEVAAMFDETTREEIQRLAKEGARETLAQSRGEVNRLSRLAGALGDSLESVLARLDAHEIRLAALGTGQESLLAGFERTEARIALVDSLGQSRDGTLQAGVSDLGRQLQKMESVQTAQEEELRSTQRRQSLLLGAVPIFLGPYIHILGHAGR